MPELPEVETIRRDLARMLTGRVLRGMEIRDPSVLTGFLPSGRPRRSIDPEICKTRVTGKQISNFERRGKYLVMEFSDLTALVFHLRMTGQILVRRPLGSERLRIDFDSGLPLCFSDRRRFGEVIFCEEWRRAPGIKDLGIEPLNGKLSGHTLMRLFLFISVG